MNRIGIVEQTAGRWPPFLKQAGGMVVFGGRADSGRCATRGREKDAGTTERRGLRSALEPLIQDGVRRGILSRWGGASGSGERALGLKSIHERAQWCMA